MKTDIYPAHRSHLTSRMTIVFVCVVLAMSVGVAVAWHWLAVRRNRRRALHILHWIETTLGPQGQATGISWIAGSRFKVPLRLRCGLFHRAWMVVEFRPSEHPLRWLASRLNGTRELLTFHADLDVPPSFSFHIRNFRWRAQSSRTPARAATAEQCGKFVISTRMDWQREISSAMCSLSRIENREFLEISFQRRSPHFSATLPLEALAPGSPVRSGMLETMRDVAASASASLS